MICKQSIKLYMYVYGWSYIQNQLSWYKEAWLAVYVAPRSAILLYKKEAAVISKKWPF